MYIKFRSQGAATETATTAPSQKESRIMSKNKCTHERITEDDQVHGYTHSVAVHPYTDENRAAHGGICVTERCRDCDATRAVLRNQGHCEYGIWRPAA